MTDSIKALPMNSAPKNNTLMRLLVDYSGEGDHPLEDAEQAWTIGFNNFEDTDVDEWQFAGWSWSQDCFCEGRGRVIGWAPFHPDVGDWRDDPSRDERWNAGLDYGMTQLCSFLSVDPQTVMWDAATETLDGDVQSVLGNILRKHFGENWGPTPAPAAKLSATDAVQTCLDIAADYWKSAGDTIADIDRPSAEERGRIQAATAITANLQAFWETLSQTPTPAQNVEPFQARVQPWMMACFGALIAGDREERNHRFLEEALELVQSTGCTAHEAHQLVDYVYGRDTGEPHQEVGGVMVTLAALCLANDLDMYQCGETELTRIWTKVDAIRAKQAAKPKHSPLPGPTACGFPDPSTRDCQNMKEVGGGMDGERYRCDVCGKGYFLDYEEMK